MTAFLIKNGIPFDVAAELDDGSALAFMIAFGEMEGNQWDWNAMSWRERERP